LQANYGYSPGAARTRDGKLWIPTRSGLAVVNPKLPHKNVDPLPVLLEQVLVDEETVARHDSVAEPDHDHRAWLDPRTANGGLRLRPDFRRLTFEFTTL